MWKYCVFQYLHLIPYNKDNHYSHTVNTRKEYFFKKDKTCK